MVAFFCPPPFMAPQSAVTPVTNVFHTSQVFSSINSGSYGYFASAPIGAASPDRLVIVVAHGWQALGDCRINGAGGTPFTLQAQTSSTQSFVRVYTALVTAGTTLNIGVQNSGSNGGIISIAVYSIKGYVSQTPTTFLATPTASDSSQSVDVSGPAGAMCLSAQMSVQNPAGEFGGTLGIVQDYSQSFGATPYYARAGRFTASSTLGGSITTTRSRVLLACVWR